MDTSTVLGVISAVIALVGMIGGLIIRDRQTMKAISDGDDKVHMRVDEIVKDYVQKDDLKDYLMPLSKSIQDLQEEQRATARRIDQVLAAVPRRATD